MPLIYNEIIALKNVVKAECEKRIETDRKIQSIEKIVDNVEKKVDTIEQLQMAAASSNEENRLSEEDIEKVDSDFAVDSVKLVKIFEEKLCEEPMYFRLVVSLLSY